ncbi:MAG: GNAT family N-acetyltransferase [Actinomycetota bacterium]|nr:GNAT family N-acetyltransferase [Actinomycetota bacterium]MDQ5807560.1 GNAT family N-acetyltransferase [Actinomycetota bacterium]
MDARAAALAFARETHARCADERLVWDHGELLRTRSLDKVWAVNVALALGPPPALSLDDVDELLGATFAGRFSSAMFEEGEATERLEAQARERGWRVEHELFMVLRREPDRVADTSAVREGTEAEIRPLMERWNEEELSDQGPETLAQLATFVDREWSARPTRSLVAGDAEATCRVWSEGGVAQVEAVYTAPEARGRGYARALLTRALELAREDEPDVVFIVADDDDTPKELYARLGFDPVARLTRVVREAA